VSVVKGPWKGSVQQPHEARAAATKPTYEGRKCEWCGEPADRQFVVREFKRAGELKQVKAFVCQAHYRRFTEQRDAAEEAKRKAREEAKRKQGR
jgi:CRISPR/Cas system-associated protein Cas10 (large subunit of type III CRISPR-Cas system)